METTPKKDAHVDEASRKKARLELHKQMLSMSLTEKIIFLKKSFKCSSEKRNNSQTKEYITGTKSFFGKEKITNKCHFQPTTTLDLKHIIGYCCNENYELCPLYQFYACSSALMSHIRR